VRPGAALVGAYSVTWWYRRTAKLAYLLGLATFMAMALGLAAAGAQEKIGPNPRFSPKPAAPPAPPPPPPALLPGGGEACYGTGAGACTELQAGP
jgi:hypothetical protein